MFVNDLPLSLSSSSIFLFADDAKWTKRSSHLLLPIFLCANHFVGGFFLAAYGEQKCMVAKDAGRRLCPLFRI